MTATPPPGSRRAARLAANEETTILTPVPEGTGALDRIPVSRQRLWIVVTSVLAAGLIAAVAFALYLWKVADKWSAQVDEVTAQNYDLGGRLADEQQQVVKLQADYDNASEQLKAVQQRVLDLSAEAAQRDDNAEFYARQINDLESVLDTASSVTNALNQCIDYKDQLIDHIRHAEDYDPDELAQFESDVNKSCQAAADASVLLQQAIAK